MNNKLVKRLVMNDNDLGGSVMMKFWQSIWHLLSSVFQRAHGRVNVYVYIYICVCIYICVYIYMCVCLLVVERPLRI